jgi:membrane associated rhomboid family serine protease
MTDETTTQVTNRCYRHPDRESFVRCQRCGRTICGECQTLAAVGVHCPECVREARGSAPRVKPRFVTAFSSSSEAPVVTYTLMGLVALFSLLALVPGIQAPVVQVVAFSGPLFLVHPWTAITHVLANFGGVLNIAFALFTIFWAGRILEGAIGRIRFVAFIVLTALGGSAAVVLLAGGPQAGTIALTAGILAAVFVMQRHFGSSNFYLVVLVGINIVFTVSSGGGWQSIVGGVVVGGLVGLLLARTRRISRGTLQIALLIGLGVVLLAIITVGAVVLS